NQKQLGRGCGLPVSFIVEVEECSVFQRTQLRKNEGAAQAAAESVEAFRRFLREVVNRGIQNAILKILESASVPLICPALCGEGHVADLREFGIVVEGCDFHLGNS